MTLGRVSEKVARVSINANQPALIIRAKLGNDTTAA